MRPIILTALLLTLVAATTAAQGLSQLPAETQTPTADTLLASDSVRTRSLLGSFRDAESYPAAWLVALDAPSAEAMTIDSAFSQIEQAWRDSGQYIDPSDPAVPQAPRRWRRVSPHPYLQEVLPGVEFYSVVGKQGRRGRIGAPSREWLMARREGKLYKMPEGLNQLLYDQGVRFTRADVPKWTRLSSLVWAIVSRDYLHSVVIGDWDYADSTYWRLPALPMLTFESVDVETTRTQARMHERARVTLDGRLVELEIRACELWLGKARSLRLGIVPLSVGAVQSGPLIEMGPIKERDGSE